MVIIKIVKGKPDFFDKIKGESATIAGLIFEVEGIPLSGSMPYKDETLLTIGISGYILWKYSPELPSYDKIKKVRENPI